MRPAAPPAKALPSNEVPALSLSTTSVDAMVSTGSSNSTVIVTLLPDLALLVSKELSEAIDMVLTVGAVTSGVIFKLSSVDIGLPFTS